MAKITHDKDAWCSRKLMTLDCYFAVCCTPKQFERELKDLRIPPNKWPEPLTTKQANATVHHLEPADGRVYKIVYIPFKPEHSPISQAGLLVHEAVHIWQWFCRYIGEFEPSSEFEAYSIQSISQALMEAYLRMRVKE